MRLVTFLDRMSEKIGALVDADRKIVDFQSAVGSAAFPFSSMQELIESGLTGLSLARDVISNATRDGRGVNSTETVQLVAPLPRPPHMRDFLGFEKHVRQPFWCGSTTPSSHVARSQESHARNGREGRVRLPEGLVRTP
jgi:hypothetical protein